MSCLPRRRKNSVSSIIKTVYCPVKGGQIDGGDCFEIVLVADSEAKSTILPEGIEWNEAQRQKCLRCQYHADIK